MPKFPAFRFLCLAALLVVAGLHAVPAHASDTDCDQVEDAIDNCPGKFNASQADLDGDGVGNPCDPDRDGDGVLDEADNCPAVGNEDQVDADADGTGDACDRCEGTAEGDAVGRLGCSIEQLCPCGGPTTDQAWRDVDQYLGCVKRKVRSLRRQRALDSDAAREIRDAAAASGCGALTPQQGDNDGDAVADADDNCPSKSNPSQADTDDDGIGDACDTDKDADTVLNKNDNCPVVANAEGQAADADNDSVGDACDVCASTGVLHRVDRDGCSLEQLCPCEADQDGSAWGTHSRYLRCVADETYRFRTLKVMTADEAQEYRASAAANTCGERPPVCE